MRDSTSRNRLQPLSGIVIFGGLLIATAGLPASSQAHPAHAGPGQHINRAMKAEGPLFTAEERALIGSKCGYDKGWDGRNIQYRNGTLHCANGREVSDPEVAEVMGRLGPRISARVERAMNRPDVRRAMNREIRSKVDGAMRKVHRVEIRRSVDRALAAERMHGRVRGEALAQVHRKHLPETHRAEMRAMARAHAEAGRVDAQAIRRQVRDSLERAMKELDRDLEEIGKERD